LGLSHLIADDLGAITPEVTALLDRFHIPGTKVLQFEYKSDLEDDTFPQKPYPRNSVIYTGTHDNDTTAGWYLKLPDAQREALKKRLGTNDRDVVWAMIREALASRSKTAIFPAQDLLELTSEARMNLPGVSEGNWRWRLQGGALTQELAQRLRILTEADGRSGSDETRGAPQRPEEDPKRRIEKRAYELYEERGRRNGQSDQDWLRAETEIKMEAKR
jgi:4-alpha-glucanotransferase